MIRYLKNTKTGELFIYTEFIAKLPYMEDYVENIIEEKEKEAEQSEAVEQVIIKEPKNDKTSAKAKNKKPLKRG